MCILINTFCQPCTNTQTRPDAMYFFWTNCFPWCFVLMRSQQNSALYCCWAPLFTDECHAKCVLISIEAMAEQKKEMYECSHSSDLTRPTISPTTHITKSFSQIVGKIGTINYDDKLWIANERKSGHTWIMDFVHPLNRLTACLWTWAVEWLTTKEQIYITICFVAESCEKKK